MFWNAFPSRKNALKLEATQENFIRIIDLFEALRFFKKADDTDPTTNELAELFMHLIKVDISPYPDFETMRICLQPRVPFKRTVKAFLVQLEDDIRIKEALEDTGVLRSEEEQMRRLVTDFLLHEFINDFSKFMSFDK